MGFFDKLKQGLAKTGRLLKTDVRDLFKSEGRLIDEKFLDEMRAILFKTDMGYDAVEQSSKKSPRTFAVASSCSTMS
jgi:fused signal recognition particle receptor